MATDTLYRTPRLPTSPVQPSPTLPKWPGTMPTPTDAGAVPTPTTTTAPLAAPSPTSIPTPTTQLGPALSAGTVPTPTTQMGPPLSTGSVPTPATTQAPLVGPSSPGTQDGTMAGALANYTPTLPGQNAPIGAVNGVDPVRVNPTQMGGFQPFIDSAYNQAASRLDPQFQQGEDRFRQQMVNRGIAQGSEAYSKAWDDFSRSKNDAYGSAMNAAMGQGLAAQGQAWGQGAQQTALAQAMRQWSDQFGLNRDQLDLNAQGQMTQQQMDAFRLNQASNLQAWQMAQAMLGMTPNMGPAQIDTYSPYQMQQSAAQANAQQNQNQSNGFWGSIGQLGSAWLGGR